LTHNYTNVRLTFVESAKNLVSKRHPIICIIASIILLFVLATGGFYLLHLQSSNIASKPAVQEITAIRDNIAKDSEISITAPISDSQPSTATSETTSVPIVPIAPAPALDKPAPVPTRASAYIQPTKTTPPSASASDGSGIYTEVAAESYMNSVMLQLVNTERAAHGLAAFSYNNQLAQAANIRVLEESVPSFVGVDHVRPDGRTFDTVYAQVGYTGFRTAGENLVWGYVPPVTFNQAELYALASQMFTTWKNSPEHYVQIISSAYNQTGISINLMNLNGHTYYFGIEEFGQK